MKLPTIIGITGGIGGGKSTISNLLMEQGYKVYIADNEAKKLQNEDAEIIVKTKKLFGDHIYTKDGLNRRLVAELVFSDSSLLLQINSIVHPIVEREIKQWIENNSNEQFLFVESAILIECGLNKIVDVVLLVTASEEVRIKRVMQRDRLTYEQVRSRIKNQLNDNHKIPVADYVIYTDDQIPLMNKLNSFLSTL
jgi:dephospho-CoA kinase